MDIDFWKMHGAGNDFILADDRDAQFPSGDRAWLARIAERRTGIGCEGIMLIRPSGSADFRMLFFNPDGAEAEMCGNGARCAARLAYDIGAAPRTMRIETAAGTVGAEVRDTDIRLDMMPPDDWHMDMDLDVDGHHVAAHYVLCGVPHTIVETDDLKRCDATGLGSSIRRHEAFRPAGTNVNFIQVTGPSSLAVRTYERGVEAETLACGTGITASALIAARLGRVRPPVTIRSAGGHRLEVGFRLTDTGADRLTLTGPTEYVYRGTVTYRP